MIRAFCLVISDVYFYSFINKLEGIHTEVNMQSKNQVTSEQSMSGFLMVYRTQFQSVISLKELQLITD